MIFAGKAQTEVPSCCGEQSTETNARALAHAHDRITWSQGGAKTPWIENCRRPESSTCLEILYIPFNQGQRPTSLIITLLSLPAGIEKATMELGWCVENKEDLNCDWEFNPLGGGEWSYLILDSFLCCISFHWKWILVSIPVQKHLWYLI